MCFLCLLEPVASGLACVRGSACPAKVTPITVKSFVFNRYVESYVYVETVYTLRLNALTPPRRFGFIDNDY